MNAQSFSRNARRAHSAPAAKRAKGFTMVELIIVLAIIALLAIIGIPFARGVLISGRVEPSANDITSTAAAMRTSFAGQGATPYNNLGANPTAVFANTAKGLASALSVSGVGTAATISHDLGETGALITVAIGSITTAGDSYTVDIPTVNNAACPGLASQLNRSSEVISINGTTVKAAGGTYDGGAAQIACTDGDTNDFVFTFR